VAETSDNKPSDDLSALAWVHSELRRSLENAHKALRRYLKEAESAARSDLDAVDAAALRSARTQLHQGVGALELVGLPAAARVLRASESAVQRMLSRPALVDETAVHTVERASFALLDYLSRLLAGKPVSPVGLFPQYAAVQALAGADRVHPADLWQADFSWHELPTEAGVQPRAADDAARGSMEAIVLRLMRRADPMAWTRLSDLCAQLAAGEPGRGKTLWQLAAAFAEAEAAGLLPRGDLHTKRVAARLLAQLRLSARHQDEPSERLAQDLLFFCAHAQAGAGATPRLDAVRQVWRFEPSAPVDFESERLGRFDPSWIAQARKRVAGAKDVWSAVAGGETHRVSGLAEQVALLGDSVDRLFPAGPVLTQAMQDTAAKVLADGGELPAPLAMEVATSVLYLDATLEDGELDQPDLDVRIRRLAQRINDVREGAEAQPLEPWMEELYRRVSDRQTMGSVVHELRASLSEVEKQIDQYFRDPSQRQLLIPVPSQLSAMRGVLSVLGMDQASQAVLHMRDDVDALAQTEVDPQQAVKAGTFDRLADNLGALSFLIDMLSVQPQLAKSLFRFDPADGSLSAVMGQSERPSAFGGLDEGPAPAAPLADEARALADSLHLQPQADHRAALESLSQRALAADLPRVAGAVSSAQRALASAPDAQSRQAVGAELAQTVGELLPKLPPPVSAPSAAPLPAGTTDLEEDAEMRDIFLEEAREVIAAAGASLDQLADQPDDVGELTTVRRAFHTLKGSSRMVGLREYGEAAWGCEQLYNARLALSPRLDADLGAFTRDALQKLSAWTDAIARGAAASWRAAPIVEAADMLRLQGRRIAIGDAAGGETRTLDLRQARDEAPPAVLPELELPVLDQAALPVDLPELTVELPTAEAAEPPGPSLTELPSLVDAFDEAAAPAEPEPLTDLIDRVPGLPSSADLDLTPAAPAVVETPALEPADFELRLDDGTVPEFQTPDLPGRAADASVLPTPTEGPDLPDLADVVELDFGAFEDGQKAPPLPEPAVTEPAHAASVADDGLDELQAGEITQPLELLQERDSAAAEAPAALPVQEMIEIDLPADDGSGFDLNFDELAAGPEAIGTDAATTDVPSESPPETTDEAPTFDLELGDERASVAPVGTGEPPVAHTALEPPAAHEPAAVPVGDVDADEEPVRVIGPLRIPIPLFNIYLNEADELSRRLGTELAEWGIEHARRPVAESTVVLAHSLAGSSATVGYAELSSLARALEHVLIRSAAAGPGNAGEPELFNEAADEIRRLLHQFAAGFLKPMTPGLLERLREHERALARRAAESDRELQSGAGLEDALDAADRSLLMPLQPPDEVPAPVESEPAPRVALPTGVTRFAALSDLPDAAPVAHAASGAFDDEEDIEAVDAIDAELFPIFEEEAEELLPQLQSRLRDWSLHPSDADAPAACMRTLHTFKGGARLSGAMRLGEMAHRLETAVEHLADGDDIDPQRIDVLLERADRMAAAYEALRKPSATPAPVAPSTPPQPVAVDLPLSFAEPVAAEDAAVPVAAAEAPLPAAEVPPPAEVSLDWTRFSDRRLQQAPIAERGAGGAAAVRVRASLLDRLVNHAGEVSITRARMDADVTQLQTAVNDLTDNLDRMRSQLRDIELQAESQISSRIEAAKAAAQAFDPLEMDRFTRFQELTRMMAESVNDVATVQRSVQRTLQSTEDQLAAQARLTRELQDDLLRTRMVEFESLADRLYRVVRQAAKDSGKQVRLDIVGGSIEVDRGVLERMVGPFEHLLRNSVAHGIEAPAQRLAAGKDPTGEVRVTVTQEGNEIGVVCGDDGAGLDLERIRQRAEERGMLVPGQAVDDAELANLIFLPGFTTTREVTELAGRGVGLDVVRSEVNAMGGRIETASTPGQGSRFKLVLPLTTAVTQVVMLRCAELRVAVPSTLIEVVRRVPTAQVEQAYAEGVYAVGDQALPFYWLGSLLQHSARGPTVGRSQAVVVVRSAAQRVALHVDEVLGNQEVVVKHVGPQLARLPGLAGVTLLPSGAVALIYNPVALAALFGEGARHRATGTPVIAQAAEPVEAWRAPLVLVVDDSLTVRRVTQRLLVREGYRVAVAKDGMDAMEKLAEERPAIMLSDIEMPRMDGFDLVRNVRADARLADLPVVMITSRIAQKHRDYAAELGVDHYLGKPYSEDELLQLVVRYAGAVQPA
jgi:chemosensory pili system protein ChpA (sensor histidine kinase/response regulator)